MKFRDNWASGLFIDGAIVLWTLGQVEIARERKTDGRLIGAQQKKTALPFSLFFPPSPKAET